MDGWDDPRMPTISALRRRGYTPESIREFCDKIGVAKRENLIEVELLEYCIREHLNKVALRRMVVFDPVKVVITNYPEDKKETVQTDENPEVSLPLLLSGMYVQRSSVIVPCSSLITSSHLMI